MLEIAEDYPAAIKPALSRVYQKKQAGARSEYLGGVRLDAPPEEPFVYLTARFFPDGGLAAFYRSEEPLPEDTEEMVDDLIELGSDYPLTLEARLAKAIIEEIHPTFLCDEVKQLYHETPPVEFLDTTDYQAITEKVEFLLDSYPYHDCVRDARLILADSLFRRQKYDEARLKYEEFAVLYPRDPQADTVRFQIANSHYLSAQREWFGDRFDIGLDPTPLKDAEKRYGEFLDAYPDSPHRSEARDRYRAVREGAAEYRLEIARLYLRRSKPQSALVRLDEIIDAYADTPQFVEAHYRKADILAGQGETEKAARVLEALATARPDLPEVRREVERRRSRLTGDNPRPFW